MVYSNNYNINLIFIRGELIMWAFLGVLWMILLVAIIILNFIPENN